MGVHQDKEIYIKVKELLGIPIDEPIFILRAQDKFATDGVMGYKYTVVDKLPIGNVSNVWISDIGKIISCFIDWQRNNRDKVKVPD